MPSQTFEDWFLGERGRVVVVDESLVSEFRREGWVKLPRLIRDEQLTRLREIYEIEEENASHTLTGEAGEDGVKESFANQTHPDMG